MAREVHARPVPQVVERSEAEIAADRRFRAFDLLMRSNRGIDLGDLRVPDRLLAGAGGRRAQ